ncbi:large-conductance mechanosensitive channel [Powellomyces hirtus]|nr:large-conductance mechanosensitive channel [Powellomyces hirtus]
MASPSTERAPLLPRAAASARAVSRSTWEDFREFIDRGKVLDLAVAVVLGAAFTSIVSSVVDDLLSPVIGLIMSHPLDQAFLVLRRANPNSEGCSKHRAWCENPKTIEQAKEVGSVTWNYGHFLQRVIDFFLIAVILFFIIKAYTRLLNKRSKFLKRIKDCPFCLEDIPEKASKCKFCGSNVTPMNRGVELPVPAERPAPSPAAH